MNKFAVLVLSTVLSALAIQTSASAEDVRIERLDDATFCFAGTDAKSMSSLQIDGKTYLAHVLSPTGVRIDLLSQAPGKCISVTVVGYRSRFKQQDAFKILELTQNSN